MKLFNRALNIVSLLLLATVFVTGCSTPRGLQHRSHRPIAKVNLVNQSQDVAKFAQLVSSMMVDSTEVTSNGRFYRAVKKGSSLLLEVT